VQFKRAEYTERRSTLKTRTDKIFFGVYWGGEGGTEFGADTFCR